jgi:CRP-like cAMP-binding protein
MGRDQARKIQTLRDVALFSSSSTKELEQLAGLFDEVEISAGTVLMREGDHGREFYVISEGSATATLRGRLLATLGRGDFFGEMSLLERAPRAATVIAETDMELFVLDARGFSTLIERAPGVGARMMAGLARRLRAIEQAPAAARA